MRFLFSFAVCLGSFLLSLQLFTIATTKKGPAKDHFFAQFNRQAEPSRLDSTQRPATKPAPAPEMAESAPQMTAAAPDVAATMPDVTEAASDVAATTTEMTAAAPDVPATTTEMTAAAPDVAAATPEVTEAAPQMTAATTEMTAATRDTTSDPVVAAQPKTQVVTNARAEATPKKKRVVRNDPRNPNWWLWGFSGLK